ncbi:hypothetical protein BWD14_01795 [Leptospira santarosai]|uniref:Uncharacterized protein n=1 Tax=Leptospira santarosai TaxID=28183 RepID=A0AB73N433_9LEPT|nr:hypothetical protein BWD14_01795 [Leptospira santarosai]
MFKLSCRSFYEAIPAGIERQSNPFKIGISPKKRELRGESPAFYRELIERSKPIFLRFLERLRRSCRCFVDKLSDPPVTNKRSPSGLFEYSDHSIRILIIRIFI